jgi:hypothetical protein
MFHRIGHWRLRLGWSDILGRLAPPNHVPVFVDTSRWNVFAWRPLLPLGAYRRCGLGLLAAVAVPVDSGRGGDGHRVVAIDVDLIIRFDAAVVAAITVGPRPSDGQAWRRRRGLFIDDGIQIVGIAAA